MQENFIQDPEWIDYETLFFFLSHGKYDSSFSLVKKDHYLEEFHIFREQMKEKLQIVEEYIKFNINRVKHANSLFSTLYSTVDIIFIRYVSSIDMRLLGIGTRIVTDDELSNRTFGRTPEDRLTKAMFLLSRGILCSNYHTISQLESTLPI